MNNINTTRIIELVDGILERPCANNFDATTIADLGYIKMYAKANDKKQGQRQDSTYDQLLTVYSLANKAGCYDAADAIRQALIEPTSKKLAALRKQEGL